MIVETLQLVVLAFLLHSIRNLTLKQQQLERLMKALSSTMQQQQQLSNNDVRTLDDEDSEKRNENQRGENGERVELKDRIQAVESSMEQQFARLATKLLDVKADLLQKQEEMALEISRQQKQISEQLKAQAEQTSLLATPVRSFASLTGGLGLESDESNHNNIITTGAPAAVSPFSKPAECSIDFNGTSPLVAKSDVTTVPEHMRNDEEYMLKLVKQNPKALKYIGEALNEKKHFVVQCMKEHCGETLEYAPAKWRDDREVVLAAVRSGSVFAESNFQFASEALRNDRDFVIQCSKERLSSLRFASDELLHDKEFMMILIIEVSGRALQYASDELRGDRDTVMCAVMQHGGALQFASNVLRSDEQVVMSAVTNDSSSIQYASESLVSSADFLLKCVEAVGAELLGVVPLQWTDDFEFMARAVKLNRDTIEYASDRLKSDADFKRAIA